jgi:hypothetical protein
MILADSGVLLAAANHDEKEHEAGAALIGGLLDGGRDLASDGG